MATLPFFRLSAPLGLVMDQRVLDGWELLADVPLLEGVSLELVPLRKHPKNPASKGGWVPGGVSQKELHRQAWSRGRPAGQRHAERLLTLQSQMPWKWEEYNERTPELVFPGTLWLPRKPTLYELQSTYGEGEWPKPSKECPTAIPVLRKEYWGWQLSFHSGDHWGYNQMLVVWK